MNIIFQRIKTEKIVAIIRGVPENKLTALAEALYIGGIKLCEVTVDQSDSDGLKRTCREIARLRESFGKSMSIGAGTVLSSAQLENVIESGAEFIISPNVDKKIIERTKEHGIVSIPGALTPTEIVAAYEYGADFVKVFPVDSLGASYIKALTAPLSHIPLLAVGGISVSNALEYLTAGCVGLGIGGSLTDKTAVENNDWTTIETNARKIVKAIK